MFKKIFSAVMVSIIFLILLGLSILSFPFLPFYFVYRHFFGHKLLVYRLSPVINGHLSKEGKPLVGAKLIRSLQCEDEEWIYDEQLTDVDGNFHFKQRLYYLPAKRFHNIEDKERQCSFRLTALVDGEEVLMHEVLAINPSLTKTYLSMLSDCSCDITHELQKFSQEYVVIEVKDYVVEGVSRCQYKKYDD